LLVASYTGGSLGSFPIQPDGSLGAVVDTFQNTGTGPNERRQEAPHMHGVASSGSFVYACDLGTDEVLAFKLGPKGELTSTRPRAAKAPPGGGPRHVVLHPNGGYLYANNEMLNSVSVYAVDKASGVPKLVQTLSTLPEGEGTGGKSTAEIACHPSGKWLYVSNRGHDSIAAFAIQPDGKLKLVKIEKAGVENPRGFDLDPSGNWLAVAGQSSDDLTSLQIDPASGKLRRSGVKVRVDKPVCVVFVK
jgi:6-phosphogluconolactonase